MSEPDRHPLARDLDHILAHTAHLWEALRGQSVFMSGGTGFVGTWLVESLLWANRELGLDAHLWVLTRHPEAFRRKAPHAASQPGLHLLEGDTQSFAFPEGRFPFVIHAATERQFTPTRDQPASMFHSDIAGTLRILQFARERGVERFLFTSSGAAYGTQPADLEAIPEEFGGNPSTTDPGAAYGHAKRIGEWLCAAHARQGGFVALLPRLFAFVGPHLPLDLNFAVGNFIRDVLNGGPVQIGGDGTPYRAYLYAADMAIWLWTILLRGENSRIYNVGSPEAITIADLSRAVVRVTAPSTPIHIERKPVPGAPAARYVPNTDRAANELGLKPLISLEEGIRRTFEWNRSAAQAS